jgi:hypothetical protein
MKRSACRDRGHFDQPDYPSLFFFDLTETLGYSFLRIHWTPLHLDATGSNQRLLGPRPRCAVHGLGRLTHTNSPHGARHDAVAAGRE